MNEVDILSLTDSELEVAIEVAGEQLLRQQRMLDGPRTRHTILPKARAAKNLYLFLLNESMIRESFKPPPF